MGIVGLLAVAVPIARKTNSESKYFLRPILVSIYPRVGRLLKRNTFRTYDFYFHAAVDIFDVRQRLWGDIRLHASPCIGKKERRNTTRIQEIFSILIHLGEETPRPVGYCWRMDRAQLHLIAREPRSSFRAWGSNRGRIGGCLCASRCAPREMLKIIRKVQKV